MIADLRLIKLVSAAVACGALAGLAATQVLAQSANTAAKVMIADFKFAPGSVTAAPNTPVTWTNNDGVPHQVVIASKNMKTAVLGCWGAGQGPERAAHDRRARQLRLRLRHPRQHEGQARRQIARAIYGWDCASRTPA